MIITDEFLEYANRGTFISKRRYFDSVEKDKKRLERIVDVKGNPALKNKAITNYYNK